MPSKYPSPRPVITYVPDDVVAEIDEAAIGDGLSRAAWMRQQILRALAKRHDSIHPAPVEAVAS